MITEVTKSTDETGAGWVLYDAECRFCVALARRTERALARREFRLAPLQTDGARAGLGNGEERLREMRVVTARGRVFGGAAAVVELARHFWWAAWLQVIVKLPLGKRALDAGYRWIAARRYCLGGACALKRVGGDEAATASENCEEVSAEGRELVGARHCGRVARRTGAGEVACPTTRQPLRRKDAMPLLGLPLVATLVTWNAPAWVLMWSLAFTLFTALKWLSWRDGSSSVLRCRSADRPGPQRARGEKGVGVGSNVHQHRDALRTRSVRGPFAASRWARNLGFLMLWPGMDARRFLAPASADSGGRARCPHRADVPISQNPSVPCGGVRTPLPTHKGEWIAAGLKTILGVVLVWGMARVTLDSSPLLAGWVGMIGLALFLHFGLFHLASLAWRAAGVDAPAIMRTPLLANSLADFWGKRWNLAFSIPARRFVLKPLALRLGRGAALILVFLVSGLMHEVVISVPARAGYGLPTAYFLAQGAAILFERSTLGRGLGLGAGWRGWVFTILFTAGPAFWLFNPTFVHRVILPFLQAIGAT